MKNNKLKLIFKGKVTNRTEASSQLISPGDSILVERGVPRLLILVCPCGCGKHLTINLDPRVGKAWKIYYSLENGLTLFPSVWLDNGCESHFIIWRNSIFLFGNDTTELSEYLPDEENRKLSSLILKQLPIHGFISFSEIADNINALPWDVLQICHILVQKRLAFEGTGIKRGWFGRLQ